MILLTSSKSSLGGKGGGVKGALFLATGGGAVGIKGGGVSGGKMPRLKSKGL